MRPISKFFYIFLLLQLLACKDKESSNNNFYTNTSNTSRYDDSESSSDDDSEASSDDASLSNENSESSNQAPNHISYTNECNYEDGVHTATVYYTNPETGFSNTYTLDVEVYDCEVIQINFPNGGWLDSDHITPSGLDENGTCTVFGEDGKTYEVVLD
jgi:hypothetical protein